MDVLSSSRIVISPDEDGEDDLLLSSNRRANYNSTNSDDISLSYELVHKPYRISTKKDAIRTIKLSFWRRLPKTRPILYLLFITLLQSYGFYIVSDLSKVSGSIIKHAVIVNGVKVGLPALFFPLGGFLGDVYVGRHLISHISLFISWSMYILLTVAFIIASYSSNITTILVILLVFIFISDGVFGINWLTFGADQLINAPTDEVSSFIYSWYWCRNFSSALAILTKFALIAVTDIKIADQLSSLIAVASLSIAVLMDEAVKKNFDVDRKNINPIKLICGVLHNAVTSRPNHPFISAFRYGEDPPSGLDYARQYHGGKYSDENVEEVRSFRRILPIILLLSGFSLTYAAFGNMNSSQIQNATSQIQNASSWQIQNASSLSEQEDNSYTYLQHQLNFFIINCVVIVLLPICSNILFPLLRHYVPNTRKRIGIGLFVTVIACTVGAVLSQVKHENFYWLLLEAILIGIAEILIYVPILEFIYAQSPDNMKGLLIGCHYFLIGLWSTVAAIVIHFINSTSQVVIMWYYVTLVVVSCVGLILFSVYSCYYENRKRNNPISDIMRISMYY